MKNFFILFLPAMAVSFLSVNCQKQTKSVTVTFSNSCDAAMQIADYETVKQRIAAIYEIKKITPLENEKFTVTFFQGKDTISAAQLLAPKGNFYIGEISGNTNDIIAAIFSNENSNYLTELATKLSYMEHSPAIGMCLAEDTAYVDSILLKAKYLTDKVKFMWSEKPVNNQEYLLLAINDRQTAVELNSKTIEKVEIEKNRYSLSVNMNFEKKLHEKWAKITKENIGNCLPIILDGKLISFPRVMSEITGGAMAISGDFNYNELLILKSIISGGQLNCDFSISE